MSILLSVAESMRFYIFISRVCMCVCSVLPGSQNRSRLLYQHQGVFKRMFVFESGGKLLSVKTFTHERVMFRRGLIFVIISWLSPLNPLQCTIKLEHTLVCAVLCSPCWHMFFLTRPCGKKPH